MLYGITVAHLPSAREGSYTHTHTHTQIYGSGVFRSIRISNTVCKDMTKYVVICSWLPTTVIDCQQDTVGQGKRETVLLGGSCTQASVGD